MEPSSAHIQELRSAFFKKLETEGAPVEGGFHPADLARVKNSDDWLRRFLIHHEGNLNDALQMMWDCLEWRKTFGTNDISESNIRMEYVNEGCLFAHNQDKDGKSILVFKSKKHVKGQKDMDELKRVVVYWFERLERMDKGNSITLFFDMADTGMSNMDMEFIKYLIGLFKVYYPNFLNYIVIFEMPWILNAAFKIIKTWLPAKAVQKIKFVNKSTLKEFVDPDQALKSWGGNDEYVFSFVPEQRLNLPLDKNDEIRKKWPRGLIITLAIDWTSEDEIVAQFRLKGERRVHFTDGSPMVESYPGNFGDIGSKQDGLTLPNSSLSILPAEVINFVNDGSELTGSVSLTNTSEKLISYKIKTTSPEKFRVRPSMGTLSPGASISINVVLQPGYQVPGLSRDKFLIMNLPVDTPDMSAAELGELWKQLSGKDVEQHRLKCSIGASSTDGQIRNGTAFGPSGSTDVDRQIAKILSQVTQLNENHCSLHADLKRSQKLQWLTITLVVVFGFAIIYFLGQEPRGVEEQTCFQP
uniref:Motile sperm domain-containing protein 2 n=1 Tax=Timema tahoe TaxID=61484 RepID=A0A7R9IGX8_9NEOP|nr:unnamed protein product [Timema tahoe]